MYNLYEELDQLELEYYGIDLDNGIIEVDDIGIDFDIDIEAYKDLEGDDLCI